MPQARKDVREWREIGGDASKDNLWDAAFAIHGTGRYLGNTHLAVRIQGRSPPLKVVTVSSQTLPALVAVTLAAAVVTATYVLAAVRPAKRGSRP